MPVISTDPPKRLVNYSLQTLQVHNDTVTACWEESYEKLGMPPD